MKDVIEVLGEMHMRGRKNTLGVEGQTLLEGLNRSFRFKGSMGASYYLISTKSPMLMEHLLSLFCDVGAIGIKDDFPS